MPSILFLYGEHGGTAVYRAFTPGHALARLGWDVDYTGDGLYVSKSGRVMGDPDVLVLVRAMGEEIPDAVRRIRERGDTLVVYDADDWFYDIPAYNPASKLPAPLVQSMHDAMSLADVVTCSTPELVEGYGQLNRTVLLPNYLDPDIWSADNEERYRTPRDNIRVGWLGAFAWRSGDLQLLRPWVKRFLRRHPECELYAPGSPELMDFLGVEGLTTPPVQDKDGRSTSIRPYQDLPAMLGHLDIGLVPLLWSKFNDSKSWCKGLEYGAMGVPTVASPSREYRSFIRPGINGELAARSHEWPRQVEQILDNLDAYREGARKVAAEHMIDDHIGRWVEAYTCTGR